MFLMQSTENRSLTGNLSFVHREKRGSALIDPIDVSREYFQIEQNVLMFFSTKLDENMVMIDDVNA